MRCAILNSAQTKWPTGNDPWVRATLQAVDDLARAGHEIVTSVGLACWELTLWRAISNGARVHVVGPIRQGDDEQDAAATIARDFAFDPRDVVWHWARSEGRGRKCAWPLRDQKVVELADRIHVVSVRPRGRLAALLQQRTFACERSHAVTYDRVSRSPRWETRMPKEPGELWSRDALVHLTRSSDGPWPGEPAWRYYEDVAQSDSYCRSAFATLGRIAREGVIRGTAFRARGKATRVCLAQVGTAEALSLVRFRARYAHYSFEPYALILSQRAARSVDARPVTYGRMGSSVFDQGAGEGGHWRREREWRIVGDLDLARLDPGEVKLVTATDEEAARLRHWSPFEVVSFGCAGPDDRKKRSGVDPKPEDGASKRV